VTTDGDRVSFGIKTTPMNTTYDELVRIWRDADTVPAIEHAWLWDHLVPLRGPVTAPLHEGWTLLAALAAQTERLRLGLLVSSNRTRPPAVLAKMAATTDLIARGRLIFGIGVGGTRVRGDFRHWGGQNPAIREFEAYGVPLVTPVEGIAALAESCTIIRRMWTEARPFDFDGRFYQLKGAICEPKPLQRPHPPILIGGYGERTLRVIAEHADIWNMPGPPFLSVDDFRRKRAVLDEHCAAMGRDPGEITRSVQIFLSGDDPAATRAMAAELIDAGVQQVILALQPPVRPAQWVADEVIEPLRAAVPTG
jgi:alkanesulfonate monooxygenase SsuD/methylene tetrahydromethanopterin reductase-like flavin-dependent oxidoreductase (luciferase family)